VCIWTKATTHILADVTAYVPAPTADGGGDGGGGGGGGGGSGGGGSTETAATFIRPNADQSGTSAFESQNVTLGPDGTAHLVYIDSWQAAAWYASCSANCSTTSAWAHTKLFTASELSGMGTGGVGVDASGRVHALFDSWADDGWSLRYTTCATSCGSASSWTITDLNEESTPTSAEATTVLMVDPDGSVSFVAAGLNEEIEWAVQHYECGGECTSTSNWISSSLFVGVPAMALRDSAGTAHVLFHPSNFDTQLRYARCAASCSDVINWEISEGAFDAFDGPSMAVTDSGRVFIGYLQFGVGNSNDERYVVNTCSGAACADVATWATFPVGDPFEGDDGAALETAGEQVLLVTTATEELRARFCESACHTAAAFAAPVAVDSRLAVGADANPYFYAQPDPPCTEPNWWAQNPTAAMTADRLVLIHNPYATFTCGQLIFDYPAIGRAISDF
jgi:hypothetical protein